MWRLGRRAAFFSIKKRADQEIHPSRTNAGAETRVVFSFNPSAGVSACAEQNYIFKSIWKTFVPVRSQAFLSFSLTVKAFNSAN